MERFDVYQDANGEPDYDQKGFLKAIEGGRKRITVESWSDLKERTERQTAWWKGILLPALAKDTGDSKEYWETKLKLAVLPDDFTPFYIPIGKQVFPIVPSITKLSCKKMTELIQGAVSHLRETPEYGDQFQWVTLPDSELRRDG